MRIPGSPDREHVRSPAAFRVAQLARESQLFFAHFEHRVRLPLPPGWQSERAEEPARWQGGVLSEPKYQAFRHDLLVASFHPGHRAKWTAHELCHSLVGFAYRPGAPLLFHALGAWLAELLPVALWYFFDEAGLRRCPAHTEGGPLFQEHCTACERAALEGMRRANKADAARIKEGLAYVDRELAAVTRSRRLGRPVGTYWATLNLASDGLAYAEAHGPRLRAPEMERWVAEYFGPQQGNHESLDALEARVLEVCAAILGKGKLRPWKASAWDYAAQDVGYRLLGAASGLDGEPRRALETMVSRLASRRTRDGIAEAVRSYRTLVEGTRGSRKAPRFPSAEDMFAVGYALPLGMGRSIRQLEEGVASACPGTHRALGREVGAVMARFAARDEPVRAPVGRRFACFIARERDDAVADLAKLEAALTHVAKSDPVARALPHHEGANERVLLAEGAEILRIDHDVLGRDPARLKRTKRLSRPRYLGVVRSGAQEVDLLELSEALARALTRARGALSRKELPVDDDSLQQLLESGLLVPERYRV